MTLRAYCRPESPRQPHLLYGGKVAASITVENHDLRTTVQLLLLKVFPSLKVMP